MHERIHHKNCIFITEKALCTSLKETRYRFVNNINICGFAYLVTHTLLLEQIANRVERFEFEAMKKKF